MVRTSRQTYEGTPTFALFWIVAGLALLPITLKTIAAVGKTIQRGHW